MTLKHVKYFKILKCLFKEHFHTLFILCSKFIRRGLWVHQDYAKIHCKFGVTSDEITAYSVYTQQAYRCAVRVSVAFCPCDQLSAKE